VWVYPTCDRSFEAAQLLRWAVGVVVLVLSCGAPHALKAQGQSSTQRDDSDKATTLVLDGQTQGQNPGTSPPKQPAQPSTLTIWLFGDVTGTASHDRQLIEVFTAGSDTPFKGLTLLQQNRQTSDSASATGNVTVGWTFRVSKSLTLTTTAGPMFNYDITSVSLIVP
jgi:hypothetical protein